MTTAALYLRRSAPDERDADGGRNRSTTAQERECRALAGRHGLEVVAVYDEGAGKSASHLTNDERPEFDKALSDLGRGYDVLVGWSLDRLTRKGMSAVGELFDLADARGARILCNDGFDTAGENGRVMASIMSEMARGEMSQLSKRTRRGKDEQRRRGEWLGGPLPYGHLRVPSASGPGTIAVDPDAKAVIIEVAERIINGATLRETCHWLNSSGHVTTEGAPWGVSTLGRFLRRPHLLGYRKYGTTVLCDSDGEPIRVTEPILRDSVFARVDKVLGSRRTKSTTKRVAGSTPTSLLAGLLHCGVCGDLMHANRDRKKNPATGEFTTRRYYRCGICVPTHSVRAEELEDNVSRLALLFVAGLDPESAITAEVGRRMLARFSPEQITRRHEIEDDIAGLEGRLKKFRKENLSGILDDDEYEALIHEGTIRRDTMLVELATLPEVRPDLGILFDLTAAADDPDADLVGEGSAWAALEHYQRRDLLRVLIEGIQIDRRRFPRTDIAGRAHVTFAEESNVIELSNRPKKVRRGSAVSKIASA